ncbi:hypothetical protein QYR58_00545 [Streptococcus iniae]|uniref:hypothetical protein n=1 Tax=Streptococcus iniae TaxID=1346 RepID=UPI002B29F26A|nr:hypothetical protein QYR55_01180 [Streptococcus iniae]WNZ90131.1 hypothetical protein QYR57_00945 [Streptococcus iniae]WNZ91755.1 hypothetical protein QYR59_01205 [Streptococcus iniae]WNZ93187.1 hypothetical protein QYR58_00545 [Streptococcus iniae]WNZ94416.1 hypothetical protein QYR54_09445 [Streptococcus iniae]
MGLLPARTAVLNYMNTVSEADVHQVMVALKPQYGQEKQFKEPLFLEHLMSLECNGYLEQAGYDLDDKDDLRILFRITDDGRLAVQKYISKTFQ